MTLSRKVGLDLRASASFRRRVSFRYPLPSVDELLLPGEMKSQNQAVDSEENLAKLRDIFTQFDTRGDEKINVSQVGDALRAFGQNPTQAEIAKCCEHWPSPDTRIDYEDFVPIYKSVAKNRSKISYEEFVEGLAHFDMEGNGTIKVAELRHLLTTLGERLTDEEVDQLIANQGDPNGHINIADFVRGILQA